ncbi:MAG: hypothetical protein AAF639_47650, partial [Chloroflexota bacterium]
MLKTLKHNPYKITLAVFILALVGARVWYQVLVLGGLEQSSAFYIGLPALIALIITFGTNTASAAKLSLLGVTMI